VSAVWWGASMTEEDVTRFSPGTAQLLGLTRAEDFAETYEGEGKDAAVSLSKSEQFVLDQSWLRHPLHA
jgi:hypothetical protein